MDFLGKLQRINGLSHWDGWFIDILIMGKIGNSVLGGMSGKVGRVVVVNLHGVEVVRSLPTVSRKKFSEKQVLQRKKFAFCSGFMSGYRAYAKRYFGERMGLVYPVNQALSNVLQAVTATEGGSFAVNFERIAFSKGVLTPPEGVTVVSTAVKTVAFAWEPGTDAASDLFRVVYCLPGEGKAFLAEVAAVRGDGTATLVLPNRFSGQSARLWAAFCAAEGNGASDSVYLGEVEVM